MDMNIKPIHPMDILVATGLVCYRKDLEEGYSQEIDGALTVISPDSPEYRAAKELLESQVAS